MNDRSWMLNPKAIRNAKVCMNIVRDELGIKLPLSHPNFLELLKEYAELTGSALLAQYFTKLASLAGVELVPPQMQSSSTPNVVPIAESPPSLVPKAG